MAFFDPALITFNGDEVKDIAELIFEKQLQNPSIESLHTVDEGIKAKKQILIMSQLNGLLGLGTGGCTPSEATNDITPSEKFWDLATISDRIPFCYKTLEPSFLNYSRKNGINAPDVSDFAAFMVDNVIANALAETIYRNVWFADKNAALVGSGGNITAGTNIAYFTKFNGLWEQLFGIVTADSNRKTNGLNTRNAGVSYAAQKFTTTDTSNRVVMNTLSDMLTDADMTLRQQEGLQYEVTQSVYDQYVKELKFANIAYTTEKVEGGLMAVKSDGIDVIAMPLADKIIRTYEDTTTSHFLPHRAVLSTKDNLRVGTESVATFNEFSIFYHEKDKKVYVDFELGLDAKVIMDAEVQLAY